MTRDKFAQELARLSDGGIRTIDLDRLRQISTPATASVYAEAYARGRREGHIMIFQQNRIVYRPRLAQ